METRPLVLVSSHEPARKSSPDSSAHRSRPSTATAVTASAAAPAPATSSTVRASTVRTSGRRSASSNGTSAGTPSTSAACSPTRTAPPGSRAGKVEADSTNNPISSVLHPAREERRTASRSVLRPQPDPGVGLPDRGRPRQGGTYASRAPTSPTSRTRSTPTSTARTCGAARVPASVHVSGHVRRQLLSLAVGRGPHPPADRVGLRGRVHAPPLSLCDRHAAAAPRRLAAPHPPLGRGGRRRQPPGAGVRRDRERGRPRLRALQRHVRVALLPRDDGPGRSPCWTTTRTAISTSMSRRAIRC